MSLIKQFNQIGFSLIELMVTLAIAGIVMTVAVPNFKTMVDNSSITSQLNDFSMDINKARAEAGRRGVRVAMCRSNDVTDSTPTCGGSNWDWSTGWLVYAVGDTRNAPLFDTSNGDVLLGKRVPESGITVYTGGNVNANLEFNPDGTTNENGVTSLIVFCGSRGTTNGRLITIKPIGRPQVSAATDCNLNHI